MAFDQLILAFVTGVIVGMAAVILLVSSVDSGKKR